jgi:hypothetical protein
MRWVSSRRRPRPQSGIQDAGQLRIEQLAERYPIACQPVRSLINGYLRERQPTVDHATLRSVSRAPVGVFWRDLELHHPGIGSLRLEPGLAAHGSTGSLSR